MLVSEKDAAKNTAGAATVEDTAGGVSWTEPTVPNFKNEFVHEANIQRSGQDYELWHNPVTGEYDLRTVEAGN